MGPLLSLAPVTFRADVCCTSPVGAPCCANSCFLSSLLRAHETCANAGCMITSIRIDITLVYTKMNTRSMVPCCEVLRMTQMFLALMLDGSILLFFTIRCHSQWVLKEWNDEDCCKCLLTHLPMKKMALWCMLYCCRDGHSASIDSTRGSYIPAYCCLHIMP